MPKEQRLFVALIQGIGFRRMVVLCRTLAMLLLASLTFPTLPARADDLWLDQPIQPWNEAGLPVPAAPPMQWSYAGMGPDCRQSARPPSTPEDEALTSAGWMLIGAYHAGWGVSLIGATADYDGMCRPAAYQAFVFVDGAFAGTSAPSPTFARTDGSLSRFSLNSGDALSAGFLRYADTDPLCCPSLGTTTVFYRVERSPAGPVVIPTSISPN
jgi:hypothetical protein